MQQILAWKHWNAAAFWVRVLQSTGLKGYANQYKVVLGTSPIILMSSWEIGASLGGFSGSLFSILTLVTGCLMQHKDRSRKLFWSRPLALIVVSSKRKSPPFCHSTLALLFGVNVIHTSGQIEWIILWVLTRVALWLLRQLAVQPRMTQRLKWSHIYSTLSLSVPLAHVQGHILHCIIT